YCYDALHRLTFKGGATDNTPWTGYSYDESSGWGVTLKNGIGRLTSQAVYLPGQTFASSILSYDSMGRLADEYTCLKSNCGSWSYHTSALYDLAGNLTSLTYPSGRKIVEGYTSAGRLRYIDFDSFAGTPVHTNYITMPTGSGDFNTWGYWPNGAPHLTETGTPASDWVNLNRRLQPDFMLTNFGSRVLSKRYPTWTDANGNNNGNLW